LLRRFGFGVPDLDRARRSARNALVLVVQDTLRPFEEGKLREMKLHDLPWPNQELLDLGDTKVRMRITLSYYIEPNPARRGWRNRYRYASHGLRFEVRRAAESASEFKKRLNQLALAEDEEKPVSDSDSDEWVLGPTLRKRGSLHSDTWEGTAADLATRGCIGIFPVSGWWKDQPKSDRSELGARYALTVSDRDRRSGRRHLHTRRRFGWHTRRDRNIEQLVFVPRVFGLEGDEGAGVVAVAVRHSFERSRERDATSVVAGGGNCVAVVVSPVTARGEARGRGRYGTDPLPSATASAFKLKVRDQTSASKVRASSSTPGRRGWRKSPGARRRSGGGWLVLGPSSDRVMLLRTG
jgi:hypothetical protein